MECREPGAIRDEELVAYLAGEKVRPAAMEHLAQCSACSARLADYQQLDLKLRSKLYRWDCPSNQLLGEYQLGMLDAESARDVQLHVQRCVLCASEVAALVEFLANDPLLVERSMVASAGVVAPPAALSNHRVVREVKRHVERLGEQTLVGARRIVATLLPSQPRLALQRDTQTQSSWPRRYAAEDVSISLQIERGPHQRGSLQLLGFVTRRGQALETLQGTPVRLIAGEQTDGSILLQRIDELGNFVFSSLIPATYALELQFPEGIVVIEQIPVPAQVD